MAKICNSVSCFLPIILFAVVMNQAILTEQYGLYIFGDSLIDIGTNNFVNGSMARANFPYNGVDYPNHESTGRFSNGYNLADFIAIQFGFEKSPAAFLCLLNHSSIFEKEILQGVNFASAGAGIFKETGILPWKAVVSLSGQIEQFATVRANITKMKGPDETTRLLANSMYIVWMGANDFFDHMRANSTVPRDKLIAQLVPLYYNQLKTLYDLGARLFFVINVPPVGCCPYARTWNKTNPGECREDLNDFARTFNTKTADLLQRLQSELPDFSYGFIDSYAVSMKLIEDYSSFGFKTATDPCCGNGTLPCYKPWGPKLCDNRTDYLFWDLYHPTEVASKYAVSLAYNSDTKYVKPISLKELMGKIQNL